MIKQDTDIALFHLVRPENLLLDEEISEFIDWHTHQGRCIADSLQDSKADDSEYSSANMAWAKAPHFF